MLLTTEEVIAASVEYCGKGGEGWSYNPIPFENVAKAQLKKVVEWLYEHNTLKTLDHAGKPVGLDLEYEDWQALLKEIE